MIAILLVGSSCAARPFEDEGFGESADEVDSSESSDDNWDEPEPPDEEWTGEVGEETTSTSTGDDATEDGIDTDTTEESTSDTTDESTGDTFGPGESCTVDEDCASNQCYVIPFLGGFCGECNDDFDCQDGGCSPPNPFDASPSTCNMGEVGGGCESTDVCMPGLVCANVLDLIGLIQINSCGTCDSDADCPGQLCAPLLDFPGWAGTNACIDPGSLPQDSYCLLEGNGDQVCESGICSVVDIMGLAQVGACGECDNDGDCGNGFCVAGQLVLDTAELTGSTCQP